jgi:hypothetical protein
MRLLELAGYLLQGASTAERVGAGRIVGGWEYVYAAYGITYAAIVIYTLSLWLRRRSAQQSEDFR